MTEIAHGDINIDLNQQEALAGLARIEGEFDATMAHIDSSSAHAEIGVKSDRFDAEIDKAKAKLDAISRSEAKVELKAKSDQVDAAIDRVKARLAELNRAKAESKVKANIAQFDAEIEKVNIALDRLNARKADVRVEVREGTRAIDQADKLAKFAERRDTVLRDTEKAAANLANSEQRSSLNLAQQEVRIISLKKHYADLTDQAEKLAKQTAYGREAKIKLKLADDKIKAEMEKDKAELELLGEIPPVHIKIDTDGSLIEKTKVKFMDFINKVRGGLDGLGNTRVNLGPISASLKGLLLGGAALAPILTSVGGSIVALAGSITTSLAGAAAVGGGLFLGLASDISGVVLAVKPAIQGFAMAQAATKTYTEAVAKYGDGSKQAKKAQEEMNNVLKSVPASSREAAVGLNAMRSEWHDLTASTAQNDFGAVLKNAVVTAHALLPGFAANTNQTMDVIRSHIDSAFSHLRQPQEIHAFDRLGADANKFLGPALSGLERFGAGILHIGEAAAHVFAGPTGAAIARWGKEFDQATQPGDKLDGTIKRLGNDAADLIHFFAAFGRLAMTVLNGASGAGDRLTNSMTNALNRYNAFLGTTRGREDMAKFFSRSVDDVKSLAQAFGPLIAAFVQWSNLLAPFTSGILKGIAFVSRLIEGLTSLVGLGGPLGTLGATLGAAFAVGKIGAFVTMLAHAVSLARELGAVGTIGRVLSGGFGNLLKAPDLAAGGAAAGSEIASAMEAAGASVAAEIAGAMRGAGIAAAGEEAAGGATGGLIGGAERIAPEVVGGAAVGEVGVEAGSVAGVEGLTGALGALGALSAPETLGLGALAAGAGILAIHFLTAKSASDKWNESLHQSATDAAHLKDNYGKFSEGLTQGQSALHQSNMSLSQMKHELDSTRQGTVQHQEAELQYNEALRSNLKLRKEAHEYSQKGQQLDQREIADRQTALQQTNELSKSKKKELEEIQRRFPLSQEAKQAAKELSDIEKQRSYQVEQVNAALNKQAAEGASLQRAYKGLPELTRVADQELGRLARTAGQAGKNISQVVATKYTSSAEVSSVSSASRKALSSGISQTAVLNVIANTNSAHAAIQSLAKEADITKHLDIIEKGGPAAVAMLSHIAGIHLTKKDVAILQHGGEQAISTVLKLIGAIGHLSPKTVAVAAKVFGTSDVSSLVAEINAVHSVTATVTAITKHISEFLTSGSSTPHRAEGGPVMPWEKTRGGMYSKPTLLVGEENRPEYVIATNPAYRDANAGYLSEAAHALGFRIDEAKKGKGGPKTSAQPKRSHLQAPEAYSASAVPLGPIQEIAKNLASAVKSEHTKLNSLHVSEAKAKVVYEHAKNIEGRAKPGKAKATAHENTKKAHDSLAGYQHGISAIEHGGVYQGVSYQRSLSRLEGESRTATDDLHKLEGANAQIEHYNSLIGTDQTKLGNLAAIYNGHGAQAGSPAILSQWQGTLADRKSNIDALAHILGVSKAMAIKLQHEHPSKELAALIDTRSAEEASNETASIESAEGSIGKESSSPSAEEYAESTAKGALPTLLNAFALAQTNNLRDNPNTPENEEIPTLYDDLKAAQALQGFWEQELQSAQATGAPIETVTDLANSLVSARGTFQGLQSQIEEGTKAAASTAYQESNAFSDARLELYKNYGSNFAPIWTQPPVGNSVQTTPIEQTTTHVQVTNNYSHPPLDPHSWSSSLQFELGALV